MVIPRVSDFNSPAFVTQIFHRESLCSTLSTTPSADIFLIEAFAVPFLFLSVAVNRNSDDLLSVGVKVKTPRPRLSVCASFLVFFPSCIETVPSTYSPLVYAASKATRQGTPFIISPPSGYRRNCNSFLSGSFLKLLAIARGVIFRL